MDWHIIAGLGAVAIQLWLSVLYVKEILHGTTRPNMVSWSLWTFSTAILLAAQIDAGPSWSLVLPIITTTFEICVVALGLFGYAYSKFGITDAICLVLSLAALGLWYITSNPVVAIVFTIGADLTAYIPTYVKTFKEPFSEASLPWLLSATVGLVSALASSQLNTANLAFPIYYFLINLGVWAIAGFGQRLKEA